MSTVSVLLSLRMPPSHNSFAPSSLLLVHTAPTRQQSINDPSWTLQTLHFLLPTKTNSLPLHQGL